MIRETLANLAKEADLRSFSDEPVAEIVQCGEPFFSGISVVKNLANLAAEMYG